MMNRHIKNSVFISNPLSLRARKARAAIQRGIARLLHQTQGLPRNSVIDENGSVIFWILIAVGLMAALSYSFMGSSRNSMNLITDTQAEAYASEIIAYGNEVKSAVKRLQLRGCSDTEISFENNVISGYTNPNSPTDKSCHVFDVAGGGVGWKQQSKDAFDNAFSSDNSYGEYIFPNSIKVEGIGTTCEDNKCVELTIVTGYLKKDICEKINTRLNVNADLSLHEGITNFTLDPNDYFIGSYQYIPIAATSTIGDSGTGAFPSNTTGGCFFRTTYGYQYFQSLLAR